MYGFDGDCSALDWAKIFGFAAISEPDQKRLISEGYYLTNGQRPYADNEPIGDSVGIQLPQGERPQSVAQRWTKK